MKILYSNILFWLDCLSVLIGLGLEPVQYLIVQGFSSVRYADKTHFKKPGYQNLTIEVLAEQDLNLVRFSPHHPLNSWNFETLDFLDPSAQSIAVLSSYSATQPLPWL